MDKLIELRKLSDEFYKDFPHDLYPEMESKIDRPYIVLLVQINKIKFAIPLRTNIRHSYCYKFTSSDRKTNSSTGIDFTKAVVILKESYLGKKVEINDKEYLEIQKKKFFIISKFKKYIDEYILFKKNGELKHAAKRYEYTPLSYFDDIILK